LLVYGVVYFAVSASRTSEGGVRPMLVAAACLAAFIGSFVGSRLIKKITLASLRIGVAVLLIFSGLALGAGVL